jgi:UDP-glucuronate decarboxylase
MKILITGGAGFLGSHLCEQLLKMDHEVICLDNFYTGFPKNIVHLLHDPRFTLLEQDVTNLIELEVDGIFNLACPASPIKYQKNPVETFRANVLGAINVLSLAQKLKIKVLQASTSEVYGDPQVNPQSENYWGNVNPIGLRSCYDEGKRAAETLFMDYFREYKLDVRIARIFNTYGPRMATDDGRVVSNFIVQAIKNDPITVYGDGNQSRSLCFVDDLINGLIKLFFADGVNYPVNLGNPSRLNMNELAHEIIELTNSKSQIVFKDLPSDDPFIREPNIDLAREVLEWKPMTERRNGLQKTISYFKTVL